MRQWPYAASGALAALTGIAGGHLIAGVLDPAASPVLAVGSAVVDATPTPVKEWAVAQFGTADKPLLLAGVTVVTLTAAAAIGHLSRRRPALALALLIALTALSTAAALARPSSTPLAVLPGLVTAAVGALTLLFLRRLATPRARDGEPATTLGPTAYPTGGPAAADRRSFLVGAAGVGAAAAAAGALGQRLATTPALPAAADLPVPARPLPALPAGVERSVRGISPFRTPNQSFYRVDTALVVPRVDPRSWRLAVDGDVERPFTLTYDELLALPMVERDITMTCVSNEVGGGYVGSARWLGVPARELLDRAGVRPGVDQVLSTSTDGFTISTPAQALTDDREALVAVAMNGQPLPARHGFPARLVTPGLYGFVGSTKWLARLTATTYAAREAYWTERGWATDAPVLTQSRIDTPRGLDVLRVGKPVAIGGVAWAQRRGISRIEVRVDDGDWLPATMGPDAGVDYWRQWFLRWTPEAGPRRRTLAVRATDGDGVLQEDARTTPFPRGATGWHSVVVFVE